MVSSSWKSLRHCKLGRAGSGAARPAIHAPPSRSPGRKSSVNNADHAYRPIYAPVPFLSSPRDTRFGYQATAC